MSFCCSSAFRCLFGTFAAAILVFLNGSATPAEPSNEKKPLSDYYGFQQLEIFKLTQRAGNLLAHDMNGDGLTDLILVDNSHSRIEILQQRKSKPTSQTVPLSSKDVNDFLDDWRFEKRKIAVNKQVASLTIGDFNSDGLKDLAYFGVPDQLVVRYQSKQGTFTERFSLRIPDVQPKMWLLAAGDLNSDKRDDLVVLGKSDTHILYQQTKGGFQKSTRLMNTSDKLSLVQIADLDGDSQNDLCYMASSGKKRFLCARFQRAKADLGPEFQFDLNQPRSITLTELDGQPGREILSIDSQTGRLTVSRVKKTKSNSDEWNSRLIQFGFGRQESGRDRAIATGDIDGDGLADVVVTDPNAAQMIVFRQKAESSLGLGTVFPGLVGANQVLMADFDGDSADEVVVLSRKEKSIGVSQMEAGRLTFPKSLPIAAEPLVMELADLNADGRLELVYLYKTGNSPTGFEVAAFSRDESGKWIHSDRLLSIDSSNKTQKWSTPATLKRFDANGDSKPDFLVFPELSRAPYLLLMKEDGKFEPSEFAGGIGLGNVSANSVYVDPTAPAEVFVSQQNFARKLKLDAQGRWQVQDQYNADDSNAKIVSSAVLNLDGQPGDEIVLVDSGIQKIRIYRTDAGMFQPWKEVDLGDFPFKSLHVADLNNDSKEDLLLFGRGQFAVLFTSQSNLKIEEITVFESQLEKTYFSDVVVGDLNSDGRHDVVLMDTRSHFLEILSTSATAKNLTHATHFKIFEEKTFSRKNGSGNEPREALITDVTGDGKDDLILLIHDRLIVYPQDGSR